MSVINTGAIRHGISEGLIDDKVISNILPFKDSAVEGSLRGADVRDMLEQSVSKIAFGGFLAVRVRSHSVACSCYGSVSLLIFLLLRASALFGILSDLQALESSAYP